MLYKYEEFKEYDAHCASVLSTLHSEDELAHENIDVIKKFLSAKGYRSYERRRLSVLKYLKWLYNFQQVDVSELYVLVKNSKAEDVELHKTYFFSLEELCSTLEKGIEEATVDCEFQGVNRDFDGLKVFFLLQWYGVDRQEFISIRLYDVDGNKIYIPATDRTIIVDEKTAKVITEYKNKTGVTIYTKDGGTRTCLFKQNTLFRSQRPEPIKVKSINNLFTPFNKCCQDTRFANNNVFDAGRYLELLEVEKQLGRDINMHDFDIIKQILRNDITTPSSAWEKVEDFKKYKADREVWLSMQEH